MRIVRFYEYGGPDVLRLEEAASPRPQPGEVLLKVELVGINYADTLHRRGIYPSSASLPRVLGADVVGTVVALGDGVSEILIGSQFTAVVQENGYAEYVTVPIDSLMPIPSGISPHNALAVTTQGQVAYHILRTAGRLQKNESVLVQAAAGGVGIFAVQIAKAMGAGTVIATASTQAKLDLARSLGADVTINYAQTGWADQVWQATRGRGVDIILEMVGGTVFEEAVTALAPYGRVVFFGMTGEDLPAVHPMQFMKLQSFIGFSSFYLQSEQPAIVQQGLTDLYTFIRQGQVKPVVEQIFPLEQVSLAHHLVETRQSRGKVVLSTGALSTEDTPG